MSEIEKKLDEVNEKLEELSVEELEQVAGGSVRNAVESVRSGVKTNCDEKPKSFLHGGGGKIVC